MKRINNLILALAGLFAVACADTFEERYDLAVNTDRLDRLQFSPAQMQKHRCDVSFIGHLYESPLQVLLYTADD